MAPRRLGDILLAHGAVDEDGLLLALESARAANERLGSQLISLGLTTESRVIEALSEQVGVPGIDLSRSTFPLSVLQLVPEAVALQEKILPLGVEGDRLLLAMADPRESRVTQEVQLISGLTVMPHVALATRLEEIIRAAFAAASKGVREFTGESASPGEGLAFVSPPPPEDIEVDLDVDETTGSIPIEIGDGETEPDEEELGSVTAREGPRTILAVDDEEEILNLVSRTLEKKGYRVEKASRGGQALERVAELLPDLILLDANLPEVHGFEICRKLKANPSYNRIPIIMMTAVYRGWRFAQDSREAYGVDDYLEKPFRIDDLVRRIEHHLARSIGEPQRDKATADRLFGEGVKLLERGEASGAIHAFEKSAEADPFSARTHYQLGRALQAAGDAYRAIGAYERTVDLRPDHFPALRSLAALYQQKGFKRKALEAWERAIPAAPDDVTRTKIKRNLLALL